MCLNKTAADLNHDGVVDQKDIDIILAHMGQHGDSPTLTTPGTTGNSAGQTGSNPGSTTGTPGQQTFTCVTDPACTGTSQSIQLCPLKCSPQ